MDQSQLMISFDPSTDKKDLSPQLQKLCKASNQSCSHHLWEQGCVGANMKRGGEFPKTLGLGNRSSYSLRVHRAKRVLDRVLVRGHLNSKNSKTRFTSKVNSNNNSYNSHQVRLIWIKRLPHQTSSSHRPCRETTIASSLDNLMGTTVGCLSTSPAPQPQRQDQSPRLAHHVSWA